MPSIRPRVIPRARRAPTLVVLAVAAASILGCGTSATGTDLGSADAGAAGPDLFACTRASSYAATGYYRVATDCGLPRLVDPDGHAFYSFGVNHVQWEGDYSPASKSNPYATAVMARYGTEEAWASATEKRLSDWGFNTVGAWSSDGALGPRMAYTHMLSLAGANWQTGVLPDYFDPAWAASVAAAAKTGTMGRASDQNLVGYFIDNEMRWGPDHRSARDLFDEYLAKDSATPGKQALVQFLLARYGNNIGRWNHAWSQALPNFAALSFVNKLPPRGQNAEADADRSAFVGYVADRFFAVTSGAIRAADPNHLVLGVRFIASLTPVEVVRAAGPYLDVVSVNAYEFIADPQSVFRPDVYGFVDLSVGAFLEGYYRLSGKPVLVGEFGFRAADAGLPNSYPPVYPTLATQRERADRYAAYAARCLAAPWIVGYHWFEWADEPPAGRFDGEDNNWGLVDNNDDPYPILTTRTRIANTN